MLYVMVLSVGLDMAVYALCVGPINFPLERRQHPPITIYLILFPIMKPTFSENRKATGSGFTILNYEII
jgi:hypothetical protein